MNDLAGFGSEIYSPMNTKLFNPNWKWWEYDFVVGNVIKEWKEKKRKHESNV